MDSNLLDVLVCPLCKGKLERKNDQLICQKDKLAYPIRDGIPIMLENEATPLAEK
ncbi:MAG TPA: Trm112 family protein [Paenalcaligenes hominis]|mgnify:CR=1 FL=1|uniref:UPF0434 protein GGR41_000423 n=1 Tax=Paenalcaligenes hominis TaxID=643674 RepID=A0A1U9JYG5_9BURK|nr:Trm112 family protein [Paenalcaligenes hominis]AQS50835.1 hypothetical protein PAEH1_03295 [Paenalcaligenes hominis]NJB64202.1 hypothetical protein [Paenalcaligenes hominis]GGE75659.1 UPF0434 protein [Paenalcaligenes hominis]HJH23820.1 Trm112 family protein [Paenalcaligenes hominis]